MSNDSNRNRVLSVAEYQLPINVRHCSRNGGEQDVNGGANARKAADRIYVRDCRQDRTTSSANERLGHLGHM
ncbi:hypothetical protein J6590_032846 [Homalodisca vitripennis]|nr:hypothetical protein J6590_032846 [Homalodisca vitripennis]